LNIGSNSYVKRRLLFEYSLLSGWGAAVHRDICSRAAVLSLTTKDTANEICTKAESLEGLAARR